MTKQTLFVLLVSVLASGCASGLPQGEFETLAQELLEPAFVALEQGV